MAACRVVPRMEFLLLYIFSFVIVVEGINYDPRFSLIKKGQDGSYFGFSVAQHQIMRDKNSVEENVLFVGAPKENVVIGGKNTGGALYRCNARQLTDCSRITDGVSTPPRSNELLEDQWLGVSVASQGPGGQLVACAHRYVQNNAALGMCFTFSQTLDYEDVVIPCKRLSHTQYMQDFGLCQTGVAVSIGQDDALVMGAPGSVYWQGVMFYVNVTDELGVSWKEVPSPYRRSDSQGTGQLSPTSSYSYNGYAVTMGKFDGTKQLYYVSGAPKSSSLGEVVIFTHRSDNALRYDKSQILQGRRLFSGFGSSLAAVDINNDGYDDLIVGAPYYYKKNHGGAFYVYLGGPSMFEGTVHTEVLSRKLGTEECEALLCEHARFGMSVSKIGDVNMDSFQDFAVGAPYEGTGAVYIYHGDNSEAGFNTDYVQRITASDLPQDVQPLSSFGYSLSGGIDLDENGYPDLLVGAYESDAVVLVRSRPIIKLHADLNVMPESIDMEAPAECPFIAGENRRCLKIELCVNYTTRPLNSIKVFPTLVYSVEAEKQRKIARVELKDSTDPFKKVLENRRVQLSPSTTCVEEYAFVKNSLDDKFNRIEFTFSFSLDLSDDDISSYPDSAIQDVNRFPVLDTEGSAGDSANSVVAWADFVKDCGDDNICNSNLQFDALLDGLSQDENGNYELIIKRENTLQVIMSVANLGEAAYETRIYVKKPKGVSYIGTESQDSVSCQGLKEDETLIKCERIGNPLRTDKSVYFILKLNVPRELVESTEIYNLTAWVNTSSLEESVVNDKHVLNFKVINKAEIFMDTNVNPDYAIMSQGQPRGASSMKDELSIGHAVRHNFIVRNSGPGVISKSFITIYWPYEVGDAAAGSGKYLLYMMRKPKIVGPVVKCNDEDIQKYINPLNIKEVRDTQLAEPVVEASSDDDIAVEEVEVKPLPDSDEAGTRRKRSAGRRVRRAAGNVVVMSCRDGTARCFEYKCMLGRLEANVNYVKITMESRLWESTLLADYQKASEVQVISWANVTISKKLMITQNTDDDEKRAVTRVVFKETSSQTVQWWIILVAVLVGIIVLLVVIFILYKLGFFKRKRQEDMQMYKAEKKQQAMLSEYDDDGV
ncbi:integrin alpha-PS1 isoform X2 [Aplysia californica]|uniref:Integrin alpha-PS1 isoform X2 n=1 Tax=Aplysia californica TaxID=6500 RepID=A0ABM1ACW9_APLCA|nr:integrin alpha-PS1 isoform X2 [Aplysia californica]